MLVKLYIITIIIIIIIIITWFFTGGFPLWSQWCIPNY